MPAMTIIWALVPAMLVVLPTPAEIQLTNTNGATIAINSFTIANNIFDPLYPHPGGRAGWEGMVRCKARLRSNGQLVRLTGTVDTMRLVAVVGHIAGERGALFNLVALSPPLLPRPAFYCTAMIGDANNLVTLAMGKR